MRRTEKLCTYFAQALPQGRPKRARPFRGTGAQGATADREKGKKPVLPACFPRRAADGARSAGAWPATDREGGNSRRERFSRLERARYIGRFPTGE